MNLPVSPYQLHRRLFKEIGVILEKRLLALAPLKRILLSQRVRETRRLCAWEMSKCICSWWVPQLVQHKKSFNIAKFELNIRKF